MPDNNREDQVVAKIESAKTPQEINAVVDEYLAAHPDSKDAMLKIQERLGAQLKQLQIDIERIRFYRPDFNTTPFILILRHLSGMLNTGLSDELSKIEQAEENTENH